MHPCLLSSSCSPPFSPSQALGNQIEGIGEGLLYGAEAVASGFALGVSDVWVRSRSGFIRQGAPGLLRGVARGAAGLLLRPLGGCLQSVAMLVEGADASLSSLARRLSLTRQLAPKPRRLPRAIGAGLAVTPYNPERAVGQVGGGEGG